MADLLKEQPGTVQGPSSMIEKLMETLREPGSSMDLSDADTQEYQMEPELPARDPSAHAPSYDGFNSSIDLTFYFLEEAKQNDADTGNGTTLNIESQEKEVDKIDAPDVSTASVGLADSGRRESCDTNYTDVLEDANDQRVSEQNNEGLTFPLGIGFDLSPCLVFQEFQHSPHKERVQKMLQEYLASPETTELFMTGLRSFLMKSGYCDKEPEVVKELDSTATGWIGKVMQIIAGSESFFSVSLSDGSALSCHANASICQNGLENAMVIYDKESQLSNAESQEQDLNSETVLSSTVQIKALLHDSSENQAVVEGVGNSTDDDAVQNANIVVASLDSFTPKRTANLKTKIAYLRRQLPDGEETLRVARTDMDRCADTDRKSKIQAGGSVLFPALFSIQEIIGANVSGKSSAKNPEKNKYNEFKVDVLSELLRWLVDTEGECTLEEFKSFQIKTRSTGLRGNENEYQQFKQFFFVDFANRLRPKKKKVNTPKETGVKRKRSASPGKAKTTNKRLKKQ